ncbi:MAG: hypothetical protein NT166_14810 [Candidatus Aminicenantes bacterium]|nr:hypothetical protein [Candidatus Aminicenantes bacterium]
MGMDELPCLGVAIQPELDSELFNIKESLVEGEWLEPGEAMVDKLRGDPGTVMTIKKIDFDIPIPDEMFSERELLKKTSSPTN